MENKRDKHEEEQREAADMQRNQRTENRCERGHVESLKGEKIIEVLQI